MVTMDLRHDPRWLDATQRAVLYRLEWEVRVAAPELGSPLVLPLIEDPLLVHDGRSPWLCTPVSRCPLTGADGRAVVPRSQLRRLDQLARRDLPFHDLVIAHELDPTGPVHDLLPRLAEGPMSCSDDTARMVVGPLPVHPGLRRAVRALERLTAPAASAATRVVDLVLDPILFGLVTAGRPERGAPSLWFRLAIWAW
ncbi:MAG: hypothetical protein ACT4O0_03165 [Pseudonocardia sp.]